MLRQLPKFTYNGLTVILSQPSRFDFDGLLSGTAGHYFDECLRPDTNIQSCDIRLADDKTPLFPGTKVLLLLGHKAHATYCDLGTTLEENRGNPFFYRNIPCISTFTPQDAMDMKDYEGKFNTYITEDNDEEDSGLAEIFESNGKGRTKRGNYRFWVREDTRKAVRILMNDGKLPKLYEQQPNYHICPPVEVVLNFLRNAQSDVLFFDKETDFISLDMRCFAISKLSDPYNVYVVPWLDIFYKPYYGYANQCRIYRALFKCINAQDNTLVAHNGKEFDFFVLAYKLRIPINKAYDTLIAQQRIYPKIEKSLGHCITLATYEPYHKNEGNHGYYNIDQAQQLYLYCGKDVFTMYLVYLWQQALMAQDAGLKASIDLAQASIRPYLTSSLLGMHYSEDERKAKLLYNDRMMMHMIRIMRVLMGPGVADLISSKKAANYFHDMLGYPIVARTKTNAACLNEENLYKLALKVENPVIQFLVKYRQIKKESGTLKFNPWIKPPGMRVEEIEYELNQGGE
jgi:hypothetical protein